MRIAQVAPLFESVPPKGYGGTERVVSYLTEALVELGHDVTLFASGDSVTSARLESMWPSSLRVPYGDLNSIAPTLSMLEKIRRRANDFDVINFHLDFFPCSLFSRTSTPFVTTLHGRLDLAHQQELFDTFMGAPFISISRSQRAELERVNWIDTVYHGLPPSLLTPRWPKQNYLAFLGRITPVKGIEAAIRISEKCNIPLRIAAKVDSVDTAYFERDVRPLLNSPLVHFIGEIGDEAKSEFLSGAKALIFPIDWPEPFGLVMIEAMACGTPVIAFGRGSVSEVIENEVTGFIVNNDHEAVMAVRRLNELSPFHIRKVFEDRFTSTVMATRYLEAYRKLIDQHKWQLEANIRANWTS